MGRADPAHDALPAEEKAEVEAAAAPLRDVDEQLRAAVVILQLDARVVDEGLRLLVMRDQLELDAAGLVRRLDVDEAARQADVELDRTVDFEGSCISIS